MSHFEDDEPPIKSHPASKEYRENFDRIFGEPEERRAQDRGDECFTCGAKPPAQCDYTVHNACHPLPPLPPDDV